MAMGVDTAGAYGESVTRTRGRTAYVEEFLSGHQRVTHRVVSTWTPTTRSRRVETLDPAGYGRRKGSGEAARRRELEAGWSRRTEELERVRFERLRRSVRVVIDHVPIESRCQARPGWEEARQQLISKRVTKRTERGTAWRRRHAVRSKANASEETEARRSKSKDPVRVTAEGRLTGRRCAGVYPVAQGVSTRTAMYLEDAVRQADAISQRKKWLEEVSSHETFGRIRVSTLEQRREAQKKGGAVLVPSHGYRGYAFQIRGVIDGSRRTRKETLKEGTLPFSTRTTPVDMGFTPAKTKVGVRGVRVWYFYA